MANPGKRNDRLKSLEIVRNIAASGDSATNGVYPRIRCRRQTDDTLGANNKKILELYQKSAAFGNKQSGNDPKRSAGKILISSLLHFICGTDLMPN